MRKFNLTIAGGVLLGVALSSAAQTVTESFNYSSGSDVAGASGGTGFGSAWSFSGGTNTIDSTTLSYGTLPSNGGSLILAGAAPMATRTLAIPLTAGADVWVGFMMRFNSLTNAPYAGIVLRPASGSGIFAGMGQNATSWGVNAEVPGFDVSTAAVSISLSTTYFIAMELQRTDATNTLVTYYVDPTIGASPGTAVGSHSYGIGDITMIGFAADNSTAFDEFRLGSSYAAISAVPEPSTTSFIAGVAGLGVTLALRRRQA